MSPPEKSNSDPVADRRRWIITGFALFLLLVLSFFLDEAVDRWIATHRMPGWETAAKMCSRYLAWPWLMLGAGVGLLVAWLRSRRDWMRVLCAVMIAASLAGLSADVLRGVTGRTRPSANVPQGWYGVRTGSQWLIIKHAYNSFPSGHVATIVAFGLPLFFWRRSLGIVVFCGVGLVAAARVYLGAHHISDVLAGAILGTLVAVLVWQRLNFKASPPQASA